MANGIYCYYDNLRCEIVYVGRDSYIDKNERHKQHYQQSKKDEQVINKVLQNDNKSGRYSYAVLEQGDFTDDELNQKEISWIAFFNPRFCFTPGGDGVGSGENHPMYNKRHTEEACEKIRKALKGKRSGKKNPRFNPCIKIKKQKNKRCKQGFRWAAQPYTPEKQIKLSSVDLQKCIEKVEEFIKSNDNVYGYTHYKIILN